MPGIRANAPSSFTSIRHVFYEGNAAFPKFGRGTEGDVTLSSSFNINSNRSNCDTIQGRLYAGTVLSNLSPTSQTDWPSGYGGISLRILGPGIVPGTTIGTQVASFTATGDRTINSNQISNLSTTTNMAVGQGISGSGLPNGTYITKIVNSNTILVSDVATSTGTGATYTCAGYLTLSQAPYAYFRPSSTSTTADMVFTIPKTNTTILSNRSVDAPVAKVIGISGNTLQLQHVTSGMSRCFFLTNPSNGQTINITLGSGVPFRSNQTYTFVTGSPANSFQVQIGADANATATAFAAAVNAQTGDNALALRATNPANGIVELSLGPDYVGDAVNTFALSSSIPSSVTVESSVQATTGAFRGGDFGSPFTDFQVGDSLLIANLQGDNTNFGNAGKWELVKVASLLSSAASFTGNDTGAWEIAGDSAFMLAVKFTPSVNVAVTRLKIRTRNDGATLGNVYTQIRTDSSGLPSSTILATSQSQPVSQMTGSYSDTPFVFNSPAVLTAGTQYWIVLTGDSRYLTNSNAGSSINLNWIGTYDGVTAANYASSADGSTWSAGVTGYRLAFDVQVSNLTLSAALQNVYGATGSNSNLAGQKILIQRIPEYSTLTINSGGILTADAWHGHWGGIVAAFCSTALVCSGTGKVQADGIGYRGGQALAAGSIGHTGESVQPRLAQSSANSSGGAAGTTGNGGASGTGGAQTSGGFANSGGSGGAGGGGAGGGGSYGATGGAGGVGASGGGGGGGGTGGGYTTCYNYSYGNGSNGSAGTGGATGGGSASGGSGGSVNYSINGGWFCSNYNIIGTGGTGGSSGAAGTGGTNGSTIGNADLSLTMHFGGGGGASGCPGASGTSGGTATAGGAGGGAILLMAKSLTNLTATCLGNNGTNGTFGSNGSNASNGSGPPSSSGGFGAGGGGGGTGGAGGGAGGSLFVMTDSLSITSVAATGGTGGAAAGTSSGGSGGFSPSAGAGGGGGAGGFGGGANAGGNGGDGRTKYLYFQDGSVYASASADGAGQYSTNTTPAAYKQSF